MRWLLISVFLCAILPRQAATPQHTFELRSGKFQLDAFPSRIQRLLQMWRLNSWTTRQLARPCADVLISMHATWSGTAWRSVICRPSYELPLVASNLPARRSQYRLPRRTLQADL